MLDNCDGAVKVNVIYKISIIRDGTLRYLNVLHQWRRYIDELMNLNTLWMYVYCVYIHQCTYIDQFKWDQNTFTGQLNNNSDFVVFFLSRLRLLRLDQLFELIRYLRILFVFILCCHRWIVQFKWNDINRYARIRQKMALIHEHEHEHEHDHDIPTYRHRVIQCNRVMCMTDKTTTTMVRSLDECTIMLCAVDFTVYGLWTCLNDNICKNNT